MYPQGITTSLADLSQSEDAVYTFLWSLYGDHGSPLFHSYGGSGQKTVLKRIKSSAWKIILPLELAQVLLSVSLYTSISNSSKRGYYEHKFFLDIQDYLGRSSLKDARANVHKDRADSPVRSKIHASVNSSKDAYLLPILSYGCRGTEIRSPYRLNELAMSMTHILERMDIYETSTYNSWLVKNFW